jgi:hypothetical protein
MVVRWARATAVFGESWLPKPAGKRLVCTGRGCFGTVLVACAVWFSSKWTRAGRFLKRCNDTDFAFGSYSWRQHCGTVTLLEPFADLSLVHGSVLWVPVLCTVRCIGWNDGLVWGGG